jgi:hypothetical protein
MTNIRHFFQNTKRYENSAFADICQENGQFREGVLFIFFSIFDRKTRSSGRNDNDIERIVGKHLRVSPGTSKSFLKTSKSFPNNIQMFFQEVADIL